MAWFLYTSNRLERLADLLATAIRAERDRPPLQPVSILVSSAGVTRWLKLALAERLGISMNLDFRYPESFFQNWSRSIDPGTDTREDLPDMGTLALRLFRVLTDLSPEQAGETLQPYTGEGPANRRMELSLRLAGLIIRTSVYRPEFLTRKPDPTDWQDRVWEAYQETYGRPRLPGDALQRHPATPDANTPTESLHVFAHPTLAPLHLESLHRIATQARVALYQLQPSPIFWGDLAGRREQRRNPEAFTGNPLVKAYGEIARDFLNRMLDHDLSPEGEVFDPPGEDSLLHCLQSDILNLHTPSPEARMALPTEPDRSLTLHRCHGPLREVEALRDQILLALKENAHLRPRDILVLAPSIEDYAPYIEAVFGVPEAGLPSLPFSIADRPATAESPVLDLVLSLLRMAHARWTSREVLHLLGLPPIRERFGFSESELELIHHWVGEAGIRWGRDPEHRRSFSGVDLPRAPHWRFGLDRLLLGLVMDDDGVGVWQGLAPLEGIAGADTDLIQRFTEALQSLFAFADFAGGNAPAAAWCAALRKLLASILSDHPDQAPERLSILSALTRLEAEAPTDHPPHFDAAAVRQWMESQCEPRRSEASFLSGGITFASLQPLRSVPSPVIGLLGMSDAAFPRRTAPLSFDRIAAEFRPGDPVPRNMDRLLFLETLLAVRERLIITYPAFSLRDQSVSEPSVVIAELMEYMEQRFTVTSSSPPWIVTHPRDGFHPSYFSGDRSLISFSPGQYAAALAQTQPADPPPSRETVIPDRPEWRERVWTPQELARILSHPTRAFLEQGLGIRLPGDRDLLPESDPDHLHSLDAYQLRQRLLQSPPGDGPSLERWRGEGKLPPGRAGITAWEKETETVAEVRSRLQSLPLEEEAEPLPIHGNLGDWPVEGWTQPRHGNALLLLRAGKIRAADRLQAWLELLLAQALTTDPPDRIWIVGSDGGEALHSLSEGPERPLATLADLLPRFLHQPEPFFPETAWNWMRGGKSGGGDPARLETSLKAEWYPNDFTSGPRESTDSWNALVWGETPFPAERFMALAREIWTPLLEGLTPLEESES